jgi:hypothetical protein
VLRRRAEDIQITPTEDRTPDLTMWVYGCGLFIMKIRAKFMIHWLIHNHNPESLTNDRLSKFKTRRYQQSLIQHCRTKLDLHKHGRQTLFLETVQEMKILKAITRIATSEENLF